MEQNTNSQPTPLTDQQPPIQPPSPDEHKSPLLLWFLILVFVGVASFFGYRGWQLKLQISQLQQTQTPSVSPEPTENDVDPTTNWKTYSNDQHHVTFKYPSDYDSGVNSGDDRRQQILASISKKTEFPDTALVTGRLLTVFRSPTHTTPTTCYTSTENNTTLTQTKTISGQQFYYSDSIETVAAGTHFTNQEYKIFVNNTCFAVTLQFIESSDWNDPSDQTNSQQDKTAAFSEFDQILSTFKFTN